MYPQKGSILKITHRLAAKI